MHVTPFVGVWIETLLTLRCFNAGNVTPFVGVWIETRTISVKQNQTTVTPFVGVWIETVKQNQTTTNIKSHPSWVCGLKPYSL